MTEKKKPQFRPKKKLKSKSLMITAGGLLILLIILLFAERTAIKTQMQILPDLRARQGSVEAASTPVEDGQFRVIIDQVLSVERGKKDCLIHYENPAENLNAARIGLYDGENGELLGNSLRIDPGRKLKSLTLNQKLESGEHEVIAVIELFEDKKPAGSLQLKLTLQVQERLE
ncbi:hypothetical protein [Holdemania massiliensis]|uniref:hypothetical protein n=1 Tax=Holdemania massiliensis TaxID=1468449 RepID=UPI001F05B2E1|nr:hypothetical protein [Holdemania massiliensis]MCH1942160.1 hypothetical protein [Holdemania massiliensis]